MQNDLLIIHVDSISTETNSIIITECEIHELDTTHIYEFYTKGRSVLVITDYSFRTSSKEFIMFVDELSKSDSFFSNCSKEKHK